MVNPFLTRRQLLRVGFSGLGTLPLLANPLVIPEKVQAGSLNSSQTQNKKPGKARIKRVIYLHQFGGPSQFETFDMKPNAPAVIRGTFKPISTSIPGYPICEALPRIAKLVDKLTILRSIEHRMTNHNSAGYYSLTGFAPPTDDQRLRDSPDLFPAFGSIVDRFAPAQKGIPTFVSYPHIIADGSITPGQHASFLGKAHDPFFFQQDPNKSDFALPELQLPDNLSLNRLQSREEMLKMIDNQSESLQRSMIGRGLDQSFEKAVQMLTATEFKKAFDLSAEPESVRSRYGKTTYGQGCLLARRLAEVGAKFITVYFSRSIGGDLGGWDTHGFDSKPMDPILKNYLLPITDLSVSALLEDLMQRGMFDDTLVLWMGEFGRSPRINKLAGRDHWPRCFTAFMAGGGLKQGFVYGSSDRQGAFPDSNPIKIEDISATIYHLLGIDPQTEFQDKLGRPFPISKGNVIQDILV